MRKPVLKVIYAVVLCFFSWAVSAVGDTEYKFAPQRLPLLRETQITHGISSRVVILVPDQDKYVKLGHQLGTSLAEKTGVRVEVMEAAKYITSSSPKQVRPELLSCNFILLGQFWNNPVLERLYARFFDCTDAVYPGPGGYTIRTICSPFKHGHNVIVATGSDFDGCKKATEKLPRLMQKTSTGWQIPFCVITELTGKAKQAEKEYLTEVFNPRYAEIEKYVEFRHPEAKIWGGWGDPRNYLHWARLNLQSAAQLGLRYWITGERRYVEVARRFLLAAIDNAVVDKMANVEYAMREMTIAWDVIEEVDVFSAADRSKINDFFNNLMFESCKGSYVARAKGVAIEKMRFYNRHQQGGTFWMGTQAEYLQRNFSLDPTGLEFVAYHIENAQLYLKRLMQSYFYADGDQLIPDEGWRTIRQALMSGCFEFVDNGTLAELADYLVVTHDNLGEFVSSGHNSPAHQEPSGGNILNVAGWLMPNEGYLWFRRQLEYGVSAYNWATPFPDSGQEHLVERFSGVYVQPISREWDRYMRENPASFRGGYQRVKDRFYYDPVPFEQSYKRISFRSGFAQDSQYLLLDGMQGIEWSLDNINAIVRYNDLGETLLLAQTDKPADRLHLNSLTVSSGKPSSRQSVQAQITAAGDFSRHALVASTVPRHDGVEWTRSVFWQKKDWFLIADEIVPGVGGENLVAQSWIGSTPFKTRGLHAYNEVGGVTLNLSSTAQRPFRTTANGASQWGCVNLTADKPFILWTLLYAEHTGKPNTLSIRQISPQAVCVLAGGTDRQEIAADAIAFRDTFTMGNLHVEADMGVISTYGISLINCRRLKIDEQELLSCNSGVTFSWNLAANTFEKGKKAFGLQLGQKPEDLSEQREVVRAALVECLTAAVKAKCFQIREIRNFAKSESPSLTILDRFSLRTPVSLATGDLDGDGNDELLLYNSKGRPRFDYPQFYTTPIAVDFDGRGKPDIAIAGGRDIAVYRQDGTLRWRKTLSSPVYALSAGDIDKDGRQDLGLTQNTWASVYNYMGDELLGEEVYHYTGTGGAFGDISGDDDIAFVVTTANGVNICRSRKKQGRIRLAQFYGVLPCRVWLRDFDKDGSLECYIGGGGTDTACYDVQNLKIKWSFSKAAVHPQDIALFDVDEDDTPEIVSGGDDGFLYVVGIDGRFLFSRQIGAPVRTLTSVCAGRGGADSLMVGLETGHVVVLDHQLKVLGRAKLADKPVTHLTVLKRKEANPVLMAADDHGNAIRFLLPQGR